MRDNIRLEDMAEALENSGEYKVLRKITGFLGRDIPSGAETSIGAFIDVETTGLNTERDQIIELGVVTFEYDRNSGEVYQLVETLSQLQDPGVPIPPLITEITGITNEMVEGKQIDLSEVERVFADVALVIAHNASFDRPFLERLHTLFADKPWACTIEDIPWKSEGINGSKLEYLALNFGYFYNSHRALDDCLAGLTVLACSLPKSREFAMATLLDSAREPILRFEATGAPYEKKDVLRYRGYRWNSDKRVWVKSVAKRDSDSERAWLKQNVFPNGVPEPVEITAFDRYSKRAK